MKSRNSKPIDVLVLTDTAAAGDLVAALLSEEADFRPKACVLDGGSIIKIVAQHAPQIVVIVDTEADPADLVGALDRARPDLPSLVILPENAMQAAQDCTLAGARATLPKPFDRQQLAKAIRQVHQREHWRRRQAAPREREAPRRTARIVAVHGGKGGVGATTVACNLAAALRQVTGQRVALVDGDVLSGAAAVLLDLAPIRTVSDLVQDGRPAGAHLTPLHNVSDLLPELNQPSEEAVDEVMARHSSGVRVLLAPEQLQDAEAIRGEDMQRTLGTLKSYFDVIVVDTASQLTPVTLAALDEADKIVLLITPELVPLRNAARFLQLTSRLGYPADKVDLVINRANSRSEISPKVMEDLLRRNITCAIPSDGQTLVKCLNMGELIAVTHPQHPITRSIAGLAESLARALDIEVRTPLAQASAASARVRRGALTGRRHRAPAAAGAAASPALRSLPARLAHSISAVFGNHRGTRAAGTAA